MRPSARSCLRVLALACLAAMPSAASAQGTGPLAPDEEASLQQIRDFVRATAERYRMVAPLEVSVASWVGSAPCSSTRRARPCTRAGGST